MKRSRIRRRRVTKRPGYDPEYRKQVRALPCIGLAEIPGHRCAAPFPDRFPVEFSHVPETFAVSGQDRGCGVPKCQALHDEYERDKSGFAERYGLTPLKLRKLARRIQREIEQGEAFG